MRLLKAIGTLFKDAFHSWSEDKVSRMSAALAYYTIFSIAPLLLIVTAIAGIVFGTEATQRELIWQIKGLIGDQGAAGIQMVLQSANRPKSGLFASAIGIIVLIFGATGVFSELQDSLKTIWGVQPKPGSSLKNLFRTRMLSFSVVLGTGFLLLVSLVISAALSAFGKYLNLYIQGLPVLMHIADFIISIFVITIFFAMMFKILPDAKITWHHW
jgi:membrane protein